jgi:PAP2 superfamily
MIASTLVLPGTDRKTGFFVFARKSVQNTFTAGGSVMSRVRVRMPLTSTFPQRAIALGTIFLLALSLLSIPGMGLIWAQGTKPASPGAAELDAGFAVEWMRLMYDRVKADTVNAPTAARVYAYAGVTLYEAVAPGILGDVSLSTQIKGMPSLPMPDASAVFDWPSVANAALQTVADGLLSSQDSHKATAALRDKQTTDRKKAVSDEVIQRSLAQGEALGKVISAWAAQDGAADAHAKAKTYKLPTGSQWDYVLTTPGTVPAEPYWGTVRPFGLEKADVCDVPLPVELSADPNSTLYKQAMEVKTVGDHLTDEQKAIATWWVDTPGQTGAPSGHWVEIANQMVGALHLKLDRTAEMYALVGMALDDAFISCWQTKFAHPYLRPVTYIHRYINPNWQSFIASPPFPTYDSGHSVASAAAAEVLTALFGEVAFTDTTHVKEGQTARSFTSFEAAAYEAAISRLYGGIHFRMDIESGLRQGRCVAQHLMTNIRLHAPSTN